MITRRHNPILLCAIALASTPWSALADISPTRARVGETHTLAVTLPAGVRTTAIDDDADVVVSLVRGEKVGNQFAYTVTYTPTQAGTFDLRSYLIGASGGPIALDKPLNVSAFSTLPANDTMTLKAVPASPDPRLGGYKLLATFVSIGWLLLLVPLLVWKRQRPTVEPTLPSPVSKPTVEEQLRTLVGELQLSNPTSTQKVRLESLLFGYWRDRRGISHLSMEAALRELQKSSEIGPMIDSLERNFYAPSAVADDTDLDAVIAPFRSMASSKERV